MQKMCISNSELVMNDAKGSRVDICHSSVQEMKNGVERTLTNLEEYETPPRKIWWTISKKLDTQYSEVVVRWTVESLKER